MPARRVRNPDRWVIVAVAKDSVTAETWQRLVEEAGIDVQVRIGDPAIAGIPRPMWMLGNYEPGTGPYSYPLHVRARDRAAARRVIGEHGGLGEGTGLDRNAVVGSVAVVGLTFLAVIIVLLLRS